MVKATRTLVLAVAWLLAACAGEPDDAFVRFDRPAEVCSEPEECVTSEATLRELRGVRLIHKRAPGSPLVAIRVMLDSGPTRTSARRVHAEHIVFELIDWWGSETFAAAWTGEVADIGAQFRSRAGLDYSHISLMVPRAHVERGFTLLGAAVNQPLIRFIRPDAFESIKKGFSVLSSAQTDEADAAASNAAWSLFAPGHPYNILSERADAIAQVEVADLAAVYSQLRDKTPLTVVVVGDLSLDAAVARVHALFEADSQPRSFALRPFEPARLERVKWVARAEAPAWHLYGLFRAPVPSADDYAALDLGLRVLSARLFDELRTRRGLVYHVATAVANQRVNYGYLTLSTTDLPAAVSAFHEILKDVIADGISVSELDAERAQLLTAFYADARSVDALSWTLGDWQMTSGDWKLAATYLTRIQAVDEDQAREAIERYVDDLRYGVAGPGGAISEGTLTGRPALCSAEPKPCGCPGAMPVTELCNRIDDDCDGKIDEGFDASVPESVKIACGVCTDTYTRENCPGHTVFVSSVELEPSFGGLEGADAKCQELAVNAGLAGAWRAILGTVDAPFRKRVSITRPIYNVHGKLAAISEVYFYDGEPLADINISETGATLPAPTAWIGTAADCSRWTSTSSDLQGSAIRVSKSLGWSSLGIKLQCDAKARLYCIGQDL